MSDKLKKLEQAEKKAQEVLKKAKAELKRERDAKAKIAEDERNAWLIILASTALNLVKSDPQLKQSVLQAAKETLSEKQYEQLLAGLKSEGVFNGGDF